MFINNCALGLLSMYAKHNYSTISEVGKLGLRTTVFKIIKGRVLFQQHLLVTAFITKYLSQKRMLRIYACFLRVVNPVGNVLRNNNENNCKKMVQLQIRKQPNKT